MNLREILKRNRVIYGLNASIKAVKTKRDYAALSETYTRAAVKRGLVYREGDIHRLLQEKLRRRGIAVKPRPKGSLRIFWVGANESQDTSGFLQSLQEFGEVIVFRNYLGGYGLELSPSPQDPKVISRNSSCLVSQIAAALEQGPIDILMGQMWANFLSIGALREVATRGIPIVNISMDDRLPNLWGMYRGVRLGSIGLAPACDLVLTTSRECCLWYLVNDCLALYWPLASNPNVFRPSHERDIGISFVGNNYGIRAALIRRLKEEGIDVRTYGKGWPNGPIGPDQMSDIFGRSRIILGVGTVAHTTDFYTLKLRDFDATMAGALYITHRNPDLVELFAEGREIECYATINEAVRKVSFYLDHPDIAQMIGEAAARKARQYHTWEKRLTSTFSMLGFL